MVSTRLPKADSFAFSTAGLRFRSQELGFAGARFLAASKQVVVAGGALTDCASSCFAAVFQILKLASANNGLAVPVQFSNAGVHGLVRAVGSLP